jgi:3-oxoacyl-[acyl-carrier-protein] synthase II
MTSRSMTEVVVTGAEVISPLGATLDEHWAALLAGRSGVAAMSHPWAAHLPVRMAGELTVDPDEQLSRPEARRYDRAQKIAMVAARGAWKDAGLHGAELDLDRVAVSVGTGMGGLASVIDQSRTMQERGPLAMTPTAIIRSMASGPAVAVGIDLGARAAVHSVSSACASGTEAIARGVELIRTGRADVVLTGGAEAAIVPQSFSAFNALRTLSTRNDDPAAASRPWDAGRDGFVMAEGAGMLVLECASHALGRGARILARLAGAGVTSDGHDLVQPHPDGLGLVRAVELAMAEAGLGRGDITHVNAHATSTRVGDLAEAKAIRAAVGDRAAVTANKSATGHMLGATGAVEVATTLRSIETGLVPPTINLDDPDVGIGLDIVTGGPRAMAVPAALKTSLGFGGHNVALVLTRW